jgi:hypothetical protein
LLNLGIHNSQNFCWEIERKKDILASSFS